MPANKLNYIVVYRCESQVFGAGSLEIALKTPPPAGVSLEDKRILYITYQPDNEILTVHQVPQEEVLNAEIEYPKKKAKESDEQEDSTS